ncbi:hypothetical protein [Martelella sp. HB161492]|uniref:hypothetical protein n=1 Tax=Martelella sp. HB161492 TaxID=2720726 RepID=UPI0015929000|nr:hypothetical protein [Martelella sp. HB161492]
MKKAIISIALILASCSTSAPDVDQESKSNPAPELQSVLNAAYQQCISEVVNRAYDPDKLGQVGLNQVTRKKYTGQVDISNTQTGNSKSYQINVDFNVGKEPWMIRGCYVLVPHGAAHGYQFLEALWDYAKSNGYKLSYYNARYYISKGNDLVRFHFQTSRTLNTILRVSISYPSGFDPSKNTVLTRLPAQSELTQ